ncbi:MAG: endonuclease III [Acholeplasmatales bacterium]|nr:endonuclease III [Acholeplasmatales bacterium]
MNNKRALEIINILKEIIADPRCELDYNNIFELVIATVLSAQTKDSRVNEVTKVLFDKYPTPALLSLASLSDVINIISPLGLAKMKASNIINLSKVLVDEYNSIVPDDIESLMKLPGVGRKTASVILVEGFKIPAVPVDTHVLRVSNRLGFSKSNNTIVVEGDIKKLLPKDLWIVSHHLFIHFGRYICLSKNPKCLGCRLKKYCTNKED